MNSIKTLAGVALALGVATGCGPSKPELHIYTWSDYIDAEVIAQFEQRENCKVVVDTFDSNEAMYAKLQAGSTGYDIMMPSSYQIPMMVKNGMIRKLDQSKLPNVAKNIDKSYLACVLDPSMTYNVPYMVTYTGFVYRKDKLGETPVDTWHVLENEGFKGRTSLLSDMRETIGGALKCLGYSLNSTNPAEIDKAVELVLKWKKNVAKFDNEQYKTAVASGEWFIGHGYSSDACQIVVEDPEHIGFALPKEGFTIAFDEMVIAANAPQPELAHKFINFVYEADIAKANIEGVCCPMPVAPALAALEPKLKKAIVIDPETLKHGEVLKDLSADRKIYDLYIKAWDKIKASE